MNIFYKLLLCIAFSPLTSIAQDARDPTIPVQIGSDSFFADGVENKSLKPSFDFYFSVFIHDGIRTLLYEGHKYKVGEFIKGLRIEKIGDISVSLRSGKTLILQPYFPGIVKSIPVDSRTYVKSK